MLTKTDRNKEDKSPKRPYRKPKLAQLGSVTEVTKSGAGASPENNQGQGQPQRRP